MIDFKHVQFDQTKIFDDCGCQIYRFFEEVNYAIHGTYLLHTDIIFNSYSAGSSTLVLEYVKYKKPFKCIGIKYKKNVVVFTCIIPTNRLYYEYQFEVRFEDDKITSITFTDGI